jgi:hypothetical protein
MNKESVVRKKESHIPIHCVIKLSLKDTFYMFHVAYNFIETSTKLTKYERCKTNLYQKER